MKSLRRMGWMWLAVVAAWSGLPPARAWCQEPAPTGVLSTGLEPAQVQRRIDPEEQEEQASSAEGGTEGSSSGRRNVGHRLSKAHIASPEEYPHITSLDDHPPESF